jgi:hypothetical protein
MEVGRRKRQTAHRDSPVSRETGLQEPFPSYPRRPASYVIYATWGKKLLTVAFAATYAARRFVEDVLEEAGCEEVEISKSRLNGWVVRWGINCEGSELRVEFDSQEACETIMEYELEGAEAEWELPEPYPTMMRQFVHGPADRPEKERAVKAKREPKEVRPKIDKSGLITANEIAEQLKVEGRDVRAILRSKMPKPAVGWAFPADQVDSIKKLIRDNLE